MESMAESAVRIAEIGMAQPSGHDLVMLAHNGPLGAPGVVSIAISALPSMPMQPHNFKELLQAAANIRIGEALSMITGLEGSKRFLQIVNYGEERA